MYFNTTELEEVPDYDHAYFNFKKTSENAVGLWVPRTYGYIPWSDRYEAKEWLFYDVSRTPYLYIDFPDSRGLDNDAERNYDGYMENLPSIILKDKKGIYREKFDDVNATIEYQIEPLNLDCGRNMDGLTIKLVKFKLLGLSFHASHLFH